jgi:acyl-CoA synthetase (NDP forming)
MSPLNPPTPTRLRKAASLSAVPDRTLAQCLLNPASVAIIGQSNDAAKTAGRPLKYLRQAGFAGRIYSVNPRRAEVLGERAWPSLAALPEAPEHAYIVTPTDGAISALEECGRAGVKVATILADGFAESSLLGYERTGQIKEIAARTGIRVVGPSSLGVVDLRSNLLLTANAAFAETGFPPGRTFVASHSGSIIGALASRGKARGIGFAALVSVGNEVDLSIGEICAATVDDPDIESYALFLESFRKADALRDFAHAAAARGKPIVAYKLGRSAEARELAVTHTGALAGDDDVADAFLADCGIARVDTFEALLEAMPLAARLPIVSRDVSAQTVGVVTTTGGGATMVVDRLAARGVRVEGPSHETLARFADAGVAVSPGRLVDLTIAGARYDVMKATLDILTSAPEFGLIVAVVGSSARFHPELAVRPIIDSAGLATPIAAFLVPDAPAALTALADAGVASFRTPESCADAIAAVFSRRTPKHAAVTSTLKYNKTRLLDENEAYELLDRIRIPRAATAIFDADREQSPTLPFPYPVAAKVLSAEIAHKSDAGGVVLNIADAEQLLAAIAQIRRPVPTVRLRANTNRVLVQPMISGIGEVLIGYRVDPDVGPLIMVAAGGLHAEIFRDRSLRLAPVDIAEARRMIEELRSIQLLQGHRGRPSGDLKALAKAVVALSELAYRPEILEAEINPMIVQEDGVVAVDALVKLAEPA